MDVAERRYLVLRTLCDRRYETIANLAEEFGVSVRTLRRDIEVLSMREPIYTVRGRYGGGVYVLDGYYVNKGYFDNSQKNIILKVLKSAENIHKDILKEQDIFMLRNMLKEFSKPCVNE